MYDMLTMQIIGAKDRHRTPWKNGRGWTEEIAISPEGATLDSFDWRISIAGTECGGPFSSFFGIERSLMMLKGKIRLFIAQAAPVILDCHSAPVAFSGDVQVISELIESPIVDFNVMTRRDCFSHSLLRERLDSGQSRKVVNPVELIMPIDNSVEVVMNHRAEKLENGAVALLKNEGGRDVRIIPGNGGVTLIWIAIQASACSSRRRPG